MKKLVLFLFCTLLFSNVACSKKGKDVIIESKVPKAIVANFKKLYAQKADSTIWKYKAEKGEYEAKAFLKGKESKFKFTKSGELTKREQELTKKELKAPIVAYISSNKKYAGFAYHKMKLKVEGGVTNYEVELKKGDEKKKLSFTQSGKFLEEESKEDK
jgi:uncharacterized membrane protein YkoI